MEEFFGFINKHKSVFVLIIAIALVVIICSNCVGVVPVNHTGVWKRLGVVQESAVPEGMQSFLWLQTRCR